LLQSSDHLRLGVIAPRHTRFPFLSLKSYSALCGKWGAGHHLGAKNADAKGKPSGKQTFGLLRRRHVRVEQIIYIGRESNRLEEMEAGVIHSAESVYTEYPDPRREEWETKILPVLKKIPIAALMRISGRSRSMLVRAMAGRSRPRRRNQELLKSILHRLGVM